VPIAGYVPLSSPYRRETMPNPTEAKLTANR
jgi:hypothetical protein